MLVPGAEGCYPPPSQVLVKVTHKIRIGIREAGSTSGEAAFSDEIRQQPDLTEFNTGIGAETIDSSRDSDLVAGHDVVQRLPTTNG